jgi:hypothetical protein
MSLSEHPNHVCPAVVAGPSEAVFTLVVPDYAARVGAASIDFGEFFSVQRFLPGRRKLTLTHVDYFTTSASVVA